VFSSRRKNLLAANPALELDYVVAVPRMARYIEVSSQIYGIYLKYVSPDDIHVYSIDEVFIDATSYLKLYKLSAHDFTMKLIREVLANTGITATAGIGTNLYLAKIAMDIVAKHNPELAGTPGYEFDYLLKKSDAIDWLNRASTSGGCCVRCSAPWLCIWTGGVKFNVNADSFLSFSSSMPNADSCAFFAAC